MPELGPYGSMRGARGNSRPYRDHWSAMRGITDISQRLVVSRSTQLFRYSCGIFSYFCNRSCNFVFGFSKLLDPMTHKGVVR